MESYIIKVITSHPGVNMTVSNFMAIQSIQELFSNFSNLFGNF